MLVLCLALAALSFLLAVPATWLVRALSTRVGALDSPGVPGQVKAAARRVPNTGGIAIVLAFALPIIAAIAALHLSSGVDLARRLVPDIDVHLPGIRAQTPAAIALLACVLALHIVGLVDDRRPLGPYLKLSIMVLLAAAAATLTQSRLLTLLDPVAGGPWLSIVLTVLWIGVITNAFNFLDNMDGLSGGVAAICAACFLTTAILTRQWFIAATLAVLAGAILGFLCFNFPRRADGGATIFMGDGGSLVVGFLIALMSVRITYVPFTNGTFYSPYETTPVSIPVEPIHWHVLLMPLIILAIPLYDFCSVTLIRLSQGRSPFVGDLQHFSHRLVRHGLSRRSAVLVIYGATCVTGIGAIMLPMLAPWQAALVGLQTLLVLLVIALYEWSREPGNGPESRRP